MDQSFQDFVQPRLARLSRVAYLLTADHHAAQDLLQNALVKLAVKWRRVHGDGDVDAYFRKILYHEHVSAWRRGRHELSGEVPEQPVQRDEAEATLRRVMVEQALAKLTARQRAVIVLRFFEDLSEVETAVALSCSVGTVKSQTHHALKRLRELAPELNALTSEVLR